MCTGVRYWWSLSLSLSLFSTFFPLVAASYLGWCSVVVFPSMCYWCVPHSIFASQFTHSTSVCAIPKAFNFLFDLLTWISLKWERYEIGQGICFEFVLSSLIFSFALSSCLPSNQACGCRMWAIQLRFFCSVCVCVCVFVWGRGWASILFPPRSLPIYLSLSLPCCLSSFLSSPIAQLHSYLLSRWWNSIEIGYGHTKMVTIFSSLFSRFVSLSLAFVAF